MSSYASYETKLTCESCSRPFPAPAGYLTFTWGAIPEEYRRPEPIRWLKSADGTIARPFRLYGDVNHLRWNFGDPALTHLLAFEVDPHVEQIECPHCHTVFSTAAVEILDGRIVGAQTYSDERIERELGRVIPDLNIVEIRNDGTWVAREEWIDPPFDQELTQP